MSAHILLVEDDAGISMILTDLLLSAGFKVDTAADGKTGLSKALNQGYDLLLLDWMLPGLTGPELCHQMREHGYDGAILLLTARGQVADRVSGLNRGADDYLVKPFDPDELLARVGALLRRVKKEDLTPVMTIEFSGFVADFGRNHFTRDSTPVSLTTKEAELLRMLVNHRGQSLSRETLLKHVWKEQPHITPRTVDVHVAWLRQKMEPQPDKPRHLLTVRGEGYRFER